MCQFDAPMDRFLGQGCSRCLRLAAALLGCVALLACVPAAGAKPRLLPRLALSHAPGSLTRGTTVDVGVRVSAGRNRTGRAVMILALSSDGRLDRRDRVLVTRSLGALRRGHSRRVKARVQVTSRMPLGQRRLLACVARARHAAPRCVGRAVRIRDTPGAGAPSPGLLSPSPNPGPSAQPSPTPTPTPGPNLPPQGDGHFPATVPTSLPGVVPDPTTVQAHPDTTRSTSGAISSASGGTLTATGGDGTTYTLDVPAGAVLSDVKVSMTPLSSIDDLPFVDGLAGGVQFGPEGLRLLQPAKLTITPSTAPTGTPVAFGYHGSGTDLALIPVAVGPGTSYVVHVMHFSGAGVAGASAQEIEDANQHAPSRTPDQFRSKLAEDVRNGADSETFTADAEAYYDAVILPELEAALNDDSLAPAAAADAMQLLRELQLLGIDFEPRATEIGDYIVRFMVNQYNHAYDRCVANHDPVETRNMIAALRSLALVGAEPAIDETKMLGCVSFKVDLDLQGRGDGGRSQPAAP